MATKIIWNNRGKNRNGSTSIKQREDHSHDTSKSARSDLSGVLSGANMYVLVRVFVSQALISGQGTSST